jgi:hypothetical protein
MEGRRFHSDACVAARCGRCNLKAAKPRTGFIVFGSEMCRSRDYQLRPDDVFVANRCLTS